MTSDNLSEKDVLITIYRVELLSIDLLVVQLASSKQKDGFGKICGNLPFLGSGSEGVGDICSHI